MLKNLILFILLLSVGANAQHKLKGQMDPPSDFKWIMLYQLQGAKQEYIANAELKDGHFGFAMADSLQTGIYRLVYDLQSSLFIDVIYNKEDIDFKFDPKFPQSSASFQLSEENKIYHTYLSEIEKPQSKLDSLQVLYFKASEEEKLNVQKLYAAFFTEFNEVQAKNEKRAEGKLAAHFIKASTRFNATKPIATPDLYLKQLKLHFFDFLDFNNPVLLNSTFINDKINDYIFYINSADDPEVNLKLQQEAINVVIDKIKSNLALSKDIQEGLLYAYSNAEMVDFVKFLLENHYSKLPVSYQDLDFKADIEGKLRTAIGGLVPDIKWKDKSLFTLPKNELFLVVFWSSSCGHCLEEMPLLYTYLENNKDITVVAVGLEEKETEADWKQQILQYPKWQHVYGQDKWKNEFAVAYGVHSTPSFYLLDSEKNVIAKPENVAELKAFFGVAN